MNLFHISLGLFFAGFLIAAIGGNSGQSFNWETGQGGGQAAAMIFGCILMLAGVVVFFIRLAQVMG